MRKALWVAARELRERWLFFPAGLVLGCVPLALPAFGVSPQDSPSFGLMIAWVLGGAAALVAGGTMLARDAASPRLGFLFSQPLPWPAIWAGKWLAAVVLAGVTGLLAAIPWMLVYPPPSGRPWLVAMGDLQGTLLAISWLVVVAGLANLGSTSFRSRSAFVAFDLACLVAAVWGVRRYGRLLLCGGPWRFTAVVGALALALLLASAVQVAAGRTDLRRAHRALSFTFWGLVLAMLLGAAVHRHWVLGAGPADLRHPWVVGGDAGGRWIQVGSTSARSQCFPQELLIDLQSGRYVVLAKDSSFTETTPVPRFWEVVFADRAELAARWTTGPDGHSTSLELFDLSSAVPRLRRLPLEGTPMPPWRTFLRLSPSGTTALLVGQSATASLFDTRSGRRLATTEVPPGQFAAQAVFTSETRARVWLYDREAARRVLDLGAGVPPEWSDISVPQPSIWPYAVPLPDGSRIVSFDGGVRLRDGRTGELLATLAEGVRSRGVVPLPDGRIALAVSSDEGARVFVFDRNGERLHEIDLGSEGPLGPVAGAAEIAPGLIGVGLGPRYSPRQSFVVDVDTGRVTNRLKGLLPVGTWPAGAPGAPVRTDGTALFTGQAGEVVSLDLATGKRTVVAGPGAPKGEAIEPVVVSGGS